jgi:formylglycine-generating enzyme required for sulfatase activity
VTTILAPATPALERATLDAWYRRNRERTAAILALVEESAMYGKPIPLRHPIVFYEGHIPAFSFLTLNQRALGEESIDPALERLFERGIDPASIDDARRYERADWPARDRIEAFAKRCDERVEAALLSARIDDPNVPRLVGGQAAYTLLEHEQMHHETLLYILHQLPYDLKGRIAQEHHDRPAPRNQPVEIPAGTATLGADRGEIPFGWDNEFERHAVDVPAFAIATFPVTNADWLAFLADGGSRPPFWVERDGEWFLRAAFEELPLPGSWPVYVSHRQAREYASWAGMELPTEAQFHRAAFGTPEGDERPFPWGLDAPSARYGNFDFDRYDPEPVDANPSGASAWGVHDLIGNGWEWTSTPFEPFPGFVPMASYPQYSADFFDGRHYVMKGASPVTAREMVRRSFRNWFFDDYPYVYAKFRVVAQP